MTEDASRYLKKNVAVSPHGNAKLAVNMSIKQKTSHDEDLPPEYLRAQRNNYCT